MNRLTYPFIALLTLSFSAGANGDEATVSDLKTRLSSPGYETRKSVVTELLHIGEKRPLRKEEIDLLLPHLRSDADWRIKVRITSVLPYAAQHDWVLPPLVEGASPRRRQKEAEDPNLGLASLCVGPCA